MIVTNCSICASQLSCCSWWAVFQTGIKNTLNVWLWLYAVERMLKSKNSKTLSLFLQDFAVESSEFEKNVHFQEQASQQRGSGASGEVEAYREIKHDIRFVRKRIKVSSNIRTWHPLAMLTCCKHTASKSVSALRQFSVIERNIDSTLRLNPSWLCKIMKASKIFFFFPVKFPLLVAKNLLDLSVICARMLL